MIIEGLFNILFGLLSGLLSLLPNIEWTVNADTFTKFFEIIKVAGYLLPMGTIVVILGLIIAINLFRVFVSFIKTLWQLIPFL